MSPSSQRWQLNNDSSRTVKLCSDRCFFSRFPMLVEWWMASLRALTVGNKTQTEGKSSYLIMLSFEAPFLIHQCPYMLLSNCVLRFCIFLVATPKAYQIYAMLVVCGRLGNRWRERRWKKRKRRGRRWKNRRRQGAHHHFLVYLSAWSGQHACNVGFYSKPARSGRFVTPCPR